MVHITVLGLCGNVFTDTLIAPTTSELVAVIAAHVNAGREIMAIEENDAELEEWLYTRTRMTEEDLLICEKDWQ